MGKKSLQTCGAGRESQKALHLRWLALLRGQIKNLILNNQNNFENQTDISEIKLQIGISCHGFVASRVERPRTQSVVGRAWLRPFAHRSNGFWLVSAVHSGRGGGLSVGKRER
jgi:hypothetical protein